MKSGKRRTSKVKSTNGRNKPYSFDNEASRKNIEEADIQVMTAMGFSASRPRKYDMIESSRNRLTSISDLLEIYETLSV
ncbi:MAG: hypothetical protein ACYS8W_01915 [Planctomycetota bacterium]